MKRSALYLFALILILSAACRKDDDLNPLEKEVEKDLTIESGKRIYSDNLGNKYHTMEFDMDHLKHVYKINLIEGKKYRITVAGEYFTSVRLSLLKTASDIVFKDPATISGRCSPQFSWTATSGGTFYLSAELMKDNDFQTATTKLIFEETTPFELSLGNMQFLCSGDWSVSEEGYLTLMRHETWKYCWAKILNHDATYRFSYNVNQVSSSYNKYIGIDCVASDDIYEFWNIPRLGYVFEIYFPSGFRTGTWHEYGGNLGYGTLPQSLPSGSNVWHNIGVQTNGDSIICSVGGEVINRFSNQHSNNSGLYITVWNDDQDTVYFKDIKLEEF